VVRIECCECGHRWRVAESLRGKTILCPECDTRVLLPKPGGEGGGRSFSLLPLFAVLLSVGGTIGLISGYNMDVGVETGLGSKVVNIGKMDDRRNTLMISGGALAVGLILTAIDSAAKRLGR
jgi:hypothetical protein